MTLFQNKIFQLCVLLVSLGLCLSAIGTIVDLWHRRDLVGAREQDLTTITRENQKLQSELRETQSDDYVERIARDKLGLVKDGEAILLLPQKQGTTSVYGGGTSNDPNWQRWWKLFF